MRCLVGLLHDHDVLVRGFLTHEVRERGRRVGFVVRDVAGPEAMLAHQDFQTGLQVGRFGVDVVAFEQVALPALRGAQEGGGVVVIDELGRMELASGAFVETVHAVLAASVPVVATVHVHAHPVTDALQQRTDVQRIIVTDGCGSSGVTVLMERARSGAMAHASGLAGFGCDRRVGAVMWEGSW